MARGEAVQASYPRERRYRRFSLQYPVHVSFRVGASLSECDAVTRNVSVGGLLLDAPSQIPADCAVNFTMTLSGGRISRPIRLTGAGRVVRVQPLEQQASYVIALECSRPITQVEKLLSAS